MPGNKPASAQSAVKPLYTASRYSASVRTAYRCRAYPDAQQQAQQNRAFGCVRVVWNRTLASRHARYTTEGKSTSYAETDRALTAMKKDPELAWLNEVSSVPLRQSLRHQQAAFSAFFDGRGRYPRYKSRSGRQTAHYTRSAFRIKDGELWLAKATAPLRVAWSWPEIDLAGLNPGTVIVAREADGRWYVTFTVDTEVPKPLPATGSANSAKARAKVARAHRKIIDARKDFLHKTSTRLIRDHDLIAAEDLNVAGMTRRAKPVPDGKGGYQRNGAEAKTGLNRSVLDAGFGEFRRQLEYKAQRYGRTMVVIDRWFPSSKTCSMCGHLLAKLSLSTRQWSCPSCGARHDLDHNAAKNILAAGQAAARTRAGDACGAGIRHEGTPPVRPAVKQELWPARTRIPVPRGGEQST